MELQEQGGVGPFSQLSGTIPHGCHCILRVGSFGAWPQNGHWKTHVRVELLGSAPTNGPLEACAGQDFTFQGGCATFYSLFSSELWLKVAHYGQWQKWSRAYLQCGRALPGGSVGISTLMNVCVSWCSVSHRALFVVKNMRMCGSFSFALKFLRLFCAMLNAHFCPQTGKV